MNRIVRMPTSAIIATVLAACASAVGPSSARVALNPSGLSPLVPAYSVVVRAGDVVSVSGMTGIKPGTQEIVEGGITAQTRQAMENIRAAVQAAGSSMERVSECTVFMVDMTDYAAMNAVYTTFFPVNPPARATVAVTALPRPAARVEVKCSAITGAPGPQSAAAHGADTVARSIDSVFDKWRSAEGPGCAVGVNRGGTTVFERGYGMANLEANTPIQATSIFHVASIAKQFTAAAILLLEREHKLSLDDDIRKYLPEIPDYGTPITIRHLLTHTSGLRDQWELLYLARGRFEEDRITEADVLDVISRQTALDFKPGTESLYSNTGYTLLGVIVRRVSGQSLQEFAARRVFQPLGMARTHFHDDYAMVVPGRTSGYELRPGPGARWRVSNPNYDVYGATNLFTTVGDLLKWEANFEHPIVGDSAMFERMGAPTTLITGDTTEYGFGLRRARTYRGARVSESSGNDPGFQAYVGRFPDHRLAIAVFCNAGSAANPTALGHAVADALLGKGLDDTPRPETPVGIALSNTVLESRAGVYLQATTLAVVRLAVRDSRLVMDGPGGRTLVPVGTNRFAVLGEAGDLVFSDGEGAGYQRRVPGQRPVFFERHQSVAPTAAMLAPYAGEFVSAELAGAIYRVVSSDSTLLMRTGTSDPLVARIAFADTFVAGTYTIQFTRTAGRVVGFEVTNPRMRRVKFTRVS